MLKASQTVGIVASATTDNAKLAATITAGNIINARINKLIAPRLPMWVRGYATTPLGEAVIANAVAAALIHTMPGNDKILLAADAIQKSAMISFAGSFDLEGMVDELLDGINIPEATKQPEGE